MKITGHIIAIAYWIGAFIFAAEVGMGGEILLVIGNHIVNHIVFSVSRGRAAIILSFSAMILFIAWSIFFCTHILMHLHGPDSAMGILVTSIYAFPVMLLFWIGAIWATLRVKKHEAKSRISNEHKTPNQAVQATGEDARA